MSASQKLKTAIVKLHEITTDETELSLLNNVYYALDHLEEKDNEINDLESPALFDAITDRVLGGHPYPDSEAMSKALKHLKALLLTELDVIPAHQRLQFALAIQHHNFDGAETTLISRVSCDLDHTLTPTHSALSADDLFDKISTDFIKSLEDEQTALRYFEAKMNIEDAVKDTARKLESYTLAEAKQFTERANQEAANRAAQAKLSRTVITSNHLFGKTITVQPKNIFNFPAVDVSIASTDSHPSDSSISDNRNPLTPKSP